MKHGNYEYSVQFIVPECFVVVAKNNFPLRWLVSFLSDTCFLSFSPASYQVVLVQRSQEGTKVCHYIETSDSPL